MGVDDTDIGPALVKMPFSYSLYMASGEAATSPNNGTSGRGSRRRVPALRESRDRAAQRPADQLTLMAVSSMTNEVWYS